MRALVACERSGVVRRALRAAGWDAWSCDLEAADDGSPEHLQGDALYFANLGWGWDLLIAHPPCTYLCNSGVGRLIHTPRNHSAGVLYGEARWEAMRAAARFVVGLWNTPIERIAIENPVMHGYARRILEAARVPSVTQYLQPYQFGDDASKLTGLRLRGLPPLMLPPIAERIAPRIVAGRPRWSNQTDSGQNRLAPSAERAQLRSKTYPGIARAMAKQWGNL